MGKSDPKSGVASGAVSGFATPGHRGVRRTRTGPRHNRPLGNSQFGSASGTMSGVASGLVTPGQQRRRIRRAASLPVEYRPTVNPKSGFSSDVVSGFVTPGQHQIGKGLVREEYRAGLNPTTGVKTGGVAAVSRAGTKTPKRKSRVESVASSLATPGRQGKRSKKKMAKSKAKCKEKSVRSASGVATATAVTPGFKSARRTEVSTIAGTPRYNQHPGAQDTTARSTVKLLQTADLPAPPPEDYKTEYRMVGVLCLSVGLFCGIIALVIRSIKQSSETTTVATEHLQYAKW